MTSERKNWITNLRVVATICVIMVHTSAILLYSCYDFTSRDWWVANIYDAPLRFCVPIFIMLTGMLLLPRNIELKPFFQKRFARVLVPFLFWSIIYILNNIYIATSNGNSFNLISAIQFFGSSFLKGASFHLWYVYMLIGLYLVIPIISKWIRYATEKEMLYFLGIWGITLFTSTHKTFALINPQYFTGFIGYLVLGYYLSIKTFNNTRLVKTISLTMLILGATITTVGVGYLSITQGRFNESLYGNLTVNVLIAAIGIFLYFKSSSFVLNKTTSTIVSFIDKYSFGIYLVHILALYFLDKAGINARFIDPIIGIPITTLACLAVSLLTVYLVNKIPVIGKYISG